MSPLERVVYYPIGVPILLLLGVLYLLWCGVFAFGRLNQWIWED